MKEYKQDIKTIFRVLGFITFWGLICLFNSTDVGLLFGVVLIIIWSYNIYDKWSYRRDKYPNEIRFPTENDSYYKMTSLTFGTLLLLGSFILLIMSFSNTSLIIPTVGFTAGLLLLINGLLDLPKGHLKINDNNMRLYGKKNEISISKIKSIELSSEKLTINTKEDKVIQLDRLVLSDKWCVSIRAFLSRYLDTEKILVTVLEPD